MREAQHLLRQRAASWRLFVMRRFLHYFTKLCLEPPRVIFDREGGSPYLSRWYLTSSQGDVDPELFDARKETTPAWLPKLFLHRFHRSDDDYALHSHPWHWAVSLVLVGGYSEERRVGDRVVRRDVRPWRLNFLTAETFHRVDLFEEDAWSLFLVGPKTGSGWAFWDRDTKMRCPWKEFVLARRGGPPAPWVPDSRE